MCLVATACLPSTISRPVPLRHVGVAFVAWPRPEMPSIPAQTIPTQAVSSHRVSPGDQELRTSPPHTHTHTCNTDTHTMRTLFSTSSFFWAGIGFCLEQLPEKHHRELNSARCLPSPPGLAGQGRLRLELAPVFQGPALGGMLSPSSPPLQAWVWLGPECCHEEKKWTSVGMQQE